VSFVKWRAPAVINDGEHKEAHGAPNSTQPNESKSIANSEMPSYKVIIVGAGLGGLVAGIALSKKGHQVTILEAAAQLGEVGAGIQVPPNSTRLLKYLGIYDRFKDVVVWPRQINLKRWKVIFFNLRRVLISEWRRLERNSS
jgi:NADPH-dependent 2,4-dienoyl-CoA reductase/sulfur reductase-like enzyme